MRSDCLPGGIFALTYKGALRAQDPSTRHKSEHSELRHKRLSVGRFRFWPAGAADRARRLEAYQLQALLAAGNPDGVQAAPPWRPLNRIR